ncbi:MAG: alpha-galactosidase [Lachnospiraceae bacterium]|nr:alpha-galactosidase [Lachnospiraceae bacterium]
MNIFFDEVHKIFKLDTPHTSYIMTIADGKYLGHAYYGAKIEDTDVAYLTRVFEPPFVPSTNGRDKLSFLDCFPMEYPTHGIGDFREDAFSIRTEDGHEACELFYKDHEIMRGKPSIQGLPATFGLSADTLTLRIDLEDPVLSLKVSLFYSVFADNDCIARSVQIGNLSNNDIYLTKVMSASMDTEGENLSLLTLNGSWARERWMQMNPLGLGFQGVSSDRGESSHQHHPFFALCSEGTDQKHGEVTAMHFVYSGNFTAKAYMGQFNNVRMMMGINGEDFCWKLSEGEIFRSPEVIMTYSGTGLGTMTRNLHALYRRHLIRSPFLHRPRPILINNWEATYFDFNTEKILAIAKQAAPLGIEMLVLDDGWFGNRFDDNRSLGDWFVNEEKLSGGLKNLVDEINKLGMKFGIWFEPEMISPESKLYEEHPDWAIQIPGRTAGLCRCQYVLDLTREEVKEYVFKCLTDICDNANIEYIKWDMNRQLADLGSRYLKKDQMGELSHRYVLAVYEIQERLLQRYPNLLLENCSGGGARFDPGMLYYSPQIWCSDDTDAIERLKIQEGTALIYPLSTMGAHVSDCPNHAVGRNTPFETRGYVALAGTFGYELDVTRIPEEDRAMIPAQTKMYHKYHELVAEGDYYRLASYASNHLYDAYMVVSEDKKEALLTYVQVLMRPNFHSRKLRLDGLAEDKMYKIYKYDISTGEEVPYMTEKTGPSAAATPRESALSGKALMNAGLLIESPWGDFKGILLVIREA